MRSAENAEIKIHSINFNQGNFLHLDIPMNNKGCKCKHERGKASWVLLKLEEKSDMKPGLGSWVSYLRLHASRDL